MTKITVYGIPNCDTIKKTLDWFKQNKLSVAFHDYKKEGVSKEKLTAWIKLTGVDILLNKKSTTWRGLSTGEQAKSSTQAGAIKLMMQHNSLIKRPVVEFADKLLVGFNENEFKGAFK